MQIQWPSKKGNIVWRTEPTVWLACVAWSPFTASCHVCYFKDTQLHLTISCREGRAARSTNREGGEEKRREERESRQMSEERHHFWDNLWHWWSKASLPFISRVCSTDRVSKVTDCIEVQWRQRIRGSIALEYSQWRDFISTKGTEAIQVDCWDIWQLWRSDWKHKETSINIYKRYFWRHSPP